MKFYSDSFKTKNYFTVLKKELKKTLLNVNKHFNYHDLNFENLYRTWEKFFSKNSCTIVLFHFLFY